MKKNSNSNVFYNINDIMELDRKIKDDIENRTYTNYDDVVENHFKAYKEMKKDYVAEKADYTDFQEFVENNSLNYDGYIWADDSVDLYLAKNVQNISYMFETIDEANNSWGGIDSSEELLEIFKEDYINKIKVINNNKIQSLLNELFIQFYIPYIETGSNEKACLYEKAFNTTTDTISDLVKN